MPIKCMVVTALLITVIFCIVITFKHGGKANGPHHWRREGVIRYTCNTCMASAWYVEDDDQRGDFETMGMLHCVPWHCHTQEVATRCFGGFNGKQRKTYGMWVVAPHK